MNIVIKKAALLDHLNRVLPMAKRKSVLEYVDYVRIALSDQDGALDMRYSAESQHYEATIAGVIESNAGGDSVNAFVARVDSLVVALSSIRNDGVNIKTTRTGVVVSSLDGESVFTLDLAASVVIQEARVFPAQFSFKAVASEFSAVSMRVGTCVTSQELRFQGIMFAVHEGRLLMMGTDSRLMAFGFVNITELSEQEGYDNNRTYSAEKGLVSRIDMFGKSTVVVSVCDNTMSVTDGQSTYTCSLLAFTGADRFAIRKYLQLQAVEGGVTVSFPAEDLGRVVEAVDGSDSISFCGQDSISRIYFHPKDAAGMMPVKSASGSASFLLPVIGDSLDHVAAYDCSLFRKAVLGFGRSKDEERIEVRFYDRYVHAHTASGFDAYLAAMAVVAPGTGAAQ